MQVWNSPPRIQTKLHQPIQTMALVQRSRLAEWLDLGWERSFTQATALDGDGKSTLTVIRKIWASK